VNIKEEVRYGYSQGYIEAFDGRLLPPSLTAQENLAEQAWVRVRAQPSADCCHSCKELQLELHESRNAATVTQLIVVAMFSVLVLGAFFVGLAGSPAVLPGQSVKRQAWRPGLASGDLSADIRSDSPGDEFRAIVVSAGRHGC